MVWPDGSMTRSENRKSWAQRSVEMVRSEQKRDEGHAGKLDGKSRAMPSWYGSSFHRRKMA